jgi:hypothetical protein
MTEEGMGRHGEAYAGLCLGGRPMQACRGEAYAGMPRHAATQRDMQTNDLNDQLKTAMQIQAVLMYLCLSSAIPTLKKNYLSTSEGYLCACGCVGVCFKVNAHEYAHGLKVETNESCRFFFCLGLCVDLNTPIDFRLLNLCSRVTQLLQNCLVFLHTHGQKKTSEENQKKYSMKGMW